MTDSGDITRDFTLVLSGGGMRGLAHVGVLQALEESGLRPREIIGSSIGALVGAAWCAGWPAAELKEVALQVSRRDLFRVAHRDMALKRMRSPALYQREPLEQLIQGLVDDVTFAELERPLLVNTVDLTSGAQRLWSRAETPTDRVADAVYASCALPGYLPPLRVNGHAFADGASVGNLPIQAAAALGRSLVIAVDVGSSVPKVAHLESGGFAAIYARAIEIAIGRMRDTDLRYWTSPPLLLLQPAVSAFPMFSFGRNGDLMEAGYRVARQALSNGGLPSAQASGVFHVPQLA
ncbi:MAG TPA: patatin-like phospholipase family protein [Gemmatimonadales bacterium]